MNEQFSLFEDDTVVRHLTMFPRPRGREDPFRGHCSACGWSSTDQAHPDDVAAAFRKHRCRPPHWRSA